MSGPSPARKPLAARALTEPDLSRLPLDFPGRSAVLCAHTAALAAGDIGYTDPGTGLFVLTAQVLADRGRCCSRGCRHCPYVDTHDSSPPAS